MNEAPATMPKANQTGSVFGGTRLRLALLVMLFLVALGLRLYRIDEPLLDYQGPRQYRSALIARALYRYHNPVVPSPQQHVADANLEINGFREPPVIEVLSVLGYRMGRGERLWIPRVLTTLIWLTGAAFLFVLVRRLADADAALVSTAFYLLLPYSVFAGRAFMCDPLMVSLFVAALYFVVRYLDAPTRGRFIAAACVSAAAVLAKPLYCAIPLVLAFTLPALGRRDGETSRAWPIVLLFAAAATVPTVIYLLLMILTGVGHTIMMVHRNFLLVSLPLKPFFWAGWLTRIADVTGLPAVFVALAGIVTFRRGRPRSLVLGLWIGYLLYGLVFTYTAYTHTYYHLLLVPIAAISVGPPVAMLLRHVVAGVRGPRARTALATLLVVVATVLSTYAYLYQRRTAALAGLTPRQRRDRSFLTAVNPDYTRVVRNAEEIGRAVDHSTKVLFISSLEAYRYYGDFSGRWWPNHRALRGAEQRGMAEKTAAERLDAHLAEWSPEYFLIVDPTELDAQPELKTLLDARYPVLRRIDEAVIYDLRTPED